MKITLTITARTTDADGTDTATQTVVGFWHRDETSVEIRYREPSGDNTLGNTATQLRVFDDRLELQRTGDYRCLLILEAGATHSCAYTTPFGDIPLTVTTQAFHAALPSEGRGELTVSYTLDAGQEPTHHELRLSIQPFE